MNTLRSLTLLLLTGVAAGGTTSQRAGETAPAARTNLTVTAVAASERRPDGWLLEFDVIVRNEGPELAEAVLLEAILDEAVDERLTEWQTETDESVRCHADVRVCEIDALPAGEQTGIRISTEIALVPAPLSIRLEFRVASRTIDTRPYDNRYFTSAFLDPRK